MMKNNTTNGFWATHHIVLFAVFAFVLISGILPPKKLEAATQTPSKLRSVSTTKKMLATTPVKPSTPRKKPVAKTLTIKTPQGFTTVPVMQKTAELPGGHISDIAFAPSDPNVVYLASNVNAMGIWKSTDSGETWTRLYYDKNFGGTHTNSIAVAPTDPNTVFSVDVHGRVGKGVGDDFKLNDLSHNTALYGLAIDAQDSNTLYVSAEDKKGTLYKSSDSAETWKEIAHLDYAIGSIVADGPNIWAGTREHGVFVSADGGATWKNELPKEEIIKIERHDADIFLATPSGVWRKKNDSPYENVLHEHAHTVRVAPSNPLVVYAGTLGGVWKSTDGGTHWKKFTTGVQNLDIGALSIDPTRDDHVITGTNIWQWSFHTDPFPKTTVGEGLYTTTDGGLHWRKIVGNFFDRDVIALAADPNDSSILYVGDACSRGIYRSMDGGKLFEFIAGGPDNAFDIAHYTMRLAADQLSNVLLTGRFGITKSADHGKTWSTTGVRRHYHGVSVSPFNPKLIIAGTSPEFVDPVMGVDSKDLPGGRIVRSVDGGVTWKETTQGFPSGATTSVHDVAFDPTDGNVVYVSTAHEQVGAEPTAKDTFGIFKSNNQGKTWQVVNEGLTSLDVDTVKVSSKKMVFSGTMNGVFVSTDGAMHWRATAMTHPIESLLVDPLGTVFAGTAEDGLFVSFDNGVTWQPVDSVPKGKIADLSISQGVLYVGVNDDGVYRSMPKP